MNMENRVKMVFTERSVSRFRENTGNRVNMENRVNIG